MKNYFHPHSYFFPPSFKSVYEMWRFEEMENVKSIQLHSIEWVIFLHHDSTDIAHKQNYYRYGKKHYSNNNLKSLLNFNLWLDGVIRLHTHLTEFIHYNENKRISPHFVPRSK